MHPGWPPCSSVEYSRHAPSSRLATPKNVNLFCTGLLALSGHVRHSSGLPAAAICRPLLVQRVSLARSRASLGIWPRRWTFAGPGEYPSGWPSHAIASYSEPRNGVLHVHAAGVVMRRATQTRRRGLARDSSSAGYSEASPVTSYIGASLLDQGLLATHKTAVGEAGSAVDGQ